MRAGIIAAILIAVAVVVVLLLRAQKMKATATGKGLRLMVLTTPATQLGFAADEDSPKVFGLLTDWNVGDETASILALKDGTASIYTTAAAGVVGGQGNPAARRAAELCARTAGQFFDKGVPVSDFPYPPKGKVHFYLLCYDGVRLCAADESAIMSGKDPLTALFVAAQNVLTALREAAEAATR